MFRSLSLLSILSIAIFNPPESLTLLAQNIPLADCAAKSQVEASWGIRTMQLPDYLRHQGLGLAPGQGQLVTSVLPGSPAAVAGMREGCLIIEVDQHPVMGNASLPVLNRSYKVTAWSDSGLREVLIQPMATDRMIRNIIDQYARPEQISGLPELLSGVAGAELAFPNLGQLVFASPRSLSVSSVNGQMLVSAIVETSAGPTRIELRGYQSEVAQQLAELPAEVQSQIAPHLGL